MKKDIGCPERNKQENGVKIDIRIMGGDVLQTFVDLSSGGKSDKSGNNISRSVKHKQKMQWSLSYFYTHTHTDSRRGGKSSWTSERQKGVRRKKGRGWQEETDDWDSLRKSWSIHPLSVTASRVLSISSAVFFFNEKGDDGSGSA
jgi:hypothetical protein